MTSIVLFGRNGQLGWELQRSLSTIAPVVALGRQDANFERAEELRAVIRKHSPQFIVNAAAYTAVDHAESDRETAMLVNHAAVKVLAEEAHRLDACLVHFSSDYVFDGTKESAYIETDATAPLNVYGVSKAAGEQVIMDAGARHVILRSSWLYSTHRANFPLRILQRAAQSDHLAVVADSVGTPTSAPMLADITASVVRKVADGGTDGGLFHVASSGEASWFDLARFLLSEAERHGVRLKTTARDVVPTTRAAYGAAADRPKNSRLDPSLLCRTFGLHMPDWTVGAAHFVENMVRLRLL